MSFKIIPITFMVVVLSVFSSVGQEKEKPKAGVSHKATKNIIVEKSNLRQLQTAQPQLRNASKSETSKALQTENGNKQKPVLQNKSAAVRPE